MGAEVIKIEDLGIGDYARQVSSAFFSSVNRNKRSLAVDLTKEEGQLIVRKLVVSADIMVESFRPGVADKLGIGYEELRKINPRLIYCSISGYGQTGPWKNKAGHDINFCASAGVLDRKGKFPVLPNFQISDIVGGTLNATMGILAALVQQKMTGCGAYLDVAIMDGVIAHSTLALARINSKEDDFLTGDCPCYTCYETSDRQFMALGAIELKFWERFCLAVGRTDLVPFHTLKSGARAEKLHTELVLLFGAHTRQYWSDKLKDVDCCVSPVLSLEEAITSEQARARNVLVSGNVHQFALPVKFSGFQFETAMPAPLHGEQTIQLLEGLGYSLAEIEGLRQGKIIL
jgi:alpha-methylacyl-CoA racemase